MTAEAMQITEKKVWAQRVVSGVNAPPVFEASEHVFDSVALLIEGCVMGDRNFSIGFGRDAGQRITEPVCIVAPAARSSLVLGTSDSISAAPLKSLISPSLSSITSGRPLPSQTARSLEFKPPLVRPIRLGRGPFLKGWQRCGAL